MDEKVKTELDNIVRVLADTGTVSRIYLFGSYASGEETPDSDIDICVLTPEKADDDFELAGHYLRKIIDVKTMPLDLLVYNQEKFDSYTDFPASFQYEIAENGVLLYEHRRTCC
jgi:predicted nucleotidyltransferase